MIKINKKIEYGLMILSFLKNQVLIENSAYSARDLSIALQLPFDSVARVLQKLQELKMLTVIHGIKGGYKIISPLPEVSFLKFCETIEEKSFYTNCEDKICEHLKHCNIRTPIHQFNLFLTQLFDKTNIEDILNQNVTALQEEQLDHHEL